MGLIVAVFTAFPKAVFAEEVKGSIESIHASQNTIIVADQLTGRHREVKINPKITSSLKKGSPVRASLSSGSNVAETLEVVV